jgi:hypothetical protein
METSSGMKAPAVKTASGMKASATMETATHAATEAAAASMETTAPATARSGWVWERQPHECSRQDPSECQRNPIAAPSSQHVFLPP